MKGKEYDSVAFSEHLNRLMVTGESNLAFVIGSSLGLHERVLTRADERISFSKMTFPHQLMRVILLEQIYRANRILKNEPYHK
ncbi:MAG: 23S rRNA (pseudouridine(1915)-N(3))-methyltransferase RlmH, partial [Lachnospiraceae bacterium]|nr:23S rRNA (pseudouridine(1915)-N(3))-methyltransferase RlmH [Lachnospiraceae bacterium]